MIAVLLALIFVAILFPGFMRLVIVALLFGIVWFWPHGAKADEAEVARAALTVYTACVTDKLSADRSLAVPDICQPEFRTFVTRCGAYAAENPDLGDICSLMWATEMVKVRNRLGIAD